MAGKLTINVRSNLSAPYGFKKDAAMTHKLITEYFKSRAGIEESENGKNYLITSYSFHSGINAEIKLRLTYSRDGDIKAFNILATFDVYKRYIKTALNQYRTIMLGFVDYLNSARYGWYIDVFVFRIFPLDFMKHFHSRVGDVITNVHLILTLGSDYCIINSDRLEFRCDNWTEESIDAVLTVLEKYTRR